MLKLTRKEKLKLNSKAAAFGRLCVETATMIAGIRTQIMQPPSGGCVLKPSKGGFIYTFFKQPPSGGCVLKQQIQSVLGAD